MVHDVEFADVHPLQDRKGSPLAAEPGAVNVTWVPATYVSVRFVVPLFTLFLSAGNAAIATPLLGLVESTVRV